MFERDIKLLEEQGFEIQKVKAKGKPARYSLVKGSGPAVSFFFNEAEVDILALLYNLFIDPAEVANIRIQVRLFFLRHSHCIIRLRKISWP